MKKRIVLVVVVLALVGYLVVRATSSQARVNPATNPMQSDTFLGCAALDGVFIDMAGNQSPKTSTIENAIYFGMKSPNQQVKVAAGALKWAVGFAQAGVGGSKPWTNALTAYAVACHALHIGPGDP